MAYYEIQSIIKNSNCLPSRWQVILKINNNKIRFSISYQNYSIIVSLTESLNDLDQINIAINYTNDPTYMSTEEMLNYLHYICNEVIKHFDSVNQN